MTPALVRVAAEHLEDLAAAKRVDELASRATDSWAAGIDDVEKAIVLGRYELDRVLGRGTHGVVFSGFDRVLERDVALKLFRSPSLILSEARALARLNHPNVVTLLDIGCADGLNYLVFGLIDGWTLGQRVRMGLDWREVVELYVKAGRGLAAAHRIGIVHGDVKPANILVGRDGRVCLADFGMARMLGWRERGESPPGGTRSYMAPERWTNAEHDAKSDQFSFCVALWEALHGQRPRLGDRTESSRVELPASLERALRRGLSTRPEDRHASMDALLETLHHVLGASARPWRRAS